jgi:hypothetical protein
MAVPKRLARWRKILRYRQPANRVYPAILDAPRCGPLKEGSSLFDAGR